MLPRRGLLGPSGLEGSGVSGSGNGPRPAPSLDVVVVVLVMEVVMGEPREQEGRLEGPEVRGESDRELGT